MLKTGRMLTFYDISALYDISLPGIHLRSAEKTTGSALTAEPKGTAPYNCRLACRGRTFATRNWPNIIRIVRNCYSILGRQASWNRVVPLRRTRVPRSKAKACTRDGASVAMKKAVTRRR
jgi:hypothetical protein